MYKEDMNMKSKVMKLAGLMMALVVCFGMTAVAAPSPSAGNFVVTGVSSAKDKSGNDISGLIKVKELPAEYASVAAELKTEAGLKAALGSDYNSNMVVADIRDVVVEGDVEFPVTLTFTMNGITTKSKVQILHYTGTEWEKIPTIVGNGTVTGTLNSLSPVAFGVDKKTVSGGTSTTGKPGSTSPKTSASSVATVALIGLFAAVAVCGLKKKTIAD